MKCPLVLRSLALAAFGVSAARAYATLFQDVTANNATLDSSNDVVENGVTYLTVYKPVPPTPNVIGPWISTNGGFSSNDSFGFQLQPSPSGDEAAGITTDKVDTRVSHADDSSALGFNSPKYLGFAVNIPQANFSPPTVASLGNSGAAGVQICQFWQGTPYSPPLTVDIMPGETDGMVNYSVAVHNDTTLGNPSSVPITILTGTIAFDTWNTFVVMADMNYDDANDSYATGQVELWQNGNLLVNWSGAVGYDPSTTPYKNPPEGTANPNSKFDVFIGPYRPIQDTEQTEYFDEARWADTYSDALPIPQAQVVLSSTSALTVPTDGDIGGSLSSGLAFSGGKLSVTSSFASGRAITVASGGGTIDVASGVNFGFGTSMTWSGGTLKIVDTGTATISQTSGTVSVSLNSVLSVASGSTTIVKGSVDPFTDSTNANNHVAIVNNGSFTVADVSSTIAGITGTGTLSVGDGTQANTLHLATSSGISTQDSLTIVGNSSLDIGNNELLIDYGSRSDPIGTIAAYIKSGYNDGSWYGPGIISPMAKTLVNGHQYGVGFADGKDGVVAGLSSGQIEVAYTLLGDANLDGIVNGIDFGILSANYGQPVTSWDQGDFNYDGVVNGIDFGDLSANYGQGLNGGASAGDVSALDAFAAANGLPMPTTSSVPEPASAGLMTLGIVGILARRRRSIESIANSSPTAVGRR